MAVKQPTIEFIPWYAPDGRMLRCDGTAGCGALVMSDDAERHGRWHQNLIDVLFGLSEVARL